MRITYTGMPQKLTAPQQKKLDAKFAKLSKLIDSRKGEKEAHVILTSERHLNRAELTVQCLDHALVGVGRASEVLNALTEAIDNLEKQLLKLRAKRRDTHRGDRGSFPLPGGAEPAEAAATRVTRVNSQPARKPMTLDEAVLVMDQDQDYLVYRDAETDRVSVLVRRRDGNLDLVEG